MKPRSGIARRLGPVWLTSIFFLALTAGGVCAQQGPFANFAGGWSGAGHVRLKDGSSERIRCLASYDPANSGNGLRLSLRCASDSYKFEFGGYAQNNDGSLSGNWSEATRHAAGQFSGRVSGNQVIARAEGQTFTALLDMTTLGDRQSILIQSPGSQVSEVSIALRRTR